MESLSENQGREKTFRIAISALKTNPAYLILFCLGLMGGPVAAGAILKSDQTVALVATVSWLIFLLASIFVVAFVESRRNPSSGSPFELPDQLASSTFSASQSAAKLSGRWHVYWYQGTGNDRKSYDPDPKETGIITTQGPGLFIHSYDPSTHSEYWLYGRLSDKSDLALFYWGKSETNILTGVVFLTVDDSFESKGNKLAGWWRGRTRDGQITVGEVEFIKYDTAKKR